MTENGSLYMSYTTYNNGDFPGGLWNSLGLMDISWSWQTIGFQHPFLEQSLFASLITKVFRNPKVDLSVGISKDDTSLKNGTSQGYSPLAKWCNVGWSWQPAQQLGPQNCHYLCSTYPFRAYLYTYPVTSPEHNPHIQDHSTSPSLIQDHRKIIQDNTQNYPSDVSSQ